MTLSKEAGSTPATVYALPLMEIVRPTSVLSPP
jgi:hypothetical protein